MVETINDLTVECVEDGVVTLKELNKIILTKGAWCTIIYKIQTWNRSKKSYNPVSYTIRRYQRYGCEFKQRSKFTISSNKQAKNIIDALTKWMQESDKKNIKANKEEFSSC